MMSAVWSGARSPEPPHLAQKAVPNNTLVVHLALLQLAYTALGGGEGLSQVRIVQITSQFIGKGRWGARSGSGGGAYGGCLDPCFSLRCPLALGVNPGHPVAVIHLPSE